MVSIRSLTTHSLYQTPRNRPPNLPDHCHTLPRLVRSRRFSNQQLCCQNHYSVHMGAALESQAQ